MTKRIYIRLAIPNQVLNLIQDLRFRDLGFVLILTFTYRLASKVSRFREFLEDAPQK